jgi:hypothetical protein
MRLLENQASNRPASAAEVIEALARVAVASDAIVDASGERRRGDRGGGLTV